MSNRLLMFFFCQSGHCLNRGCIIWSIFYFPAMTFSNVWTKKCFETSLSRGILANLDVTNILTFRFFSSTNSCKNFSNRPCKKRAPMWMGRGFILKLQKTKDTFIFLRILRVQKSDLPVHLAVPRLLAPGRWLLQHLPKPDIGELGRAKSSVPSPHRLRAIRVEFVLDAICKPLLS